MLRKNFGADEGEKDTFICYEDVRTLRGHDCETPDVLCGGFPCQDVSIAGKGAGLTGGKSGLWREFSRLIAEIRPRYVIVENVPPLRYRGLEEILADFLACGYDAEWDCLPAEAFGARHERDRLFIVAYPHNPEPLIGNRDRPSREIIVPTSDWEVEPGIRRMAHGVPNRMDRTRVLGNAVVPQVAEWIGYRILEYEKVANRGGVVLD